VSAATAAGSTPLLLQSLTIHRLAGLGDIHLTLDPLSPGINILFGPNGVGKSRTVSAINLALWPAAVEHGPRDSISAHFQIGADHWSVAVDGDAVSHQRNGVDAPGPPALAAAAERDRYNLALAELLADKDRAFAAAIGREIAGGYDLASAAAALGIARRPIPKQNDLTKTVERAIEAVQQRRRRVDDLLKDETDLADWLEKRELARAAMAARPKLETALQLIDAAEAHRAAQAVVAGFPPAIARLTGQELGQLQQVRRYRHDLSGEIEKVAVQRRRAVAEMAESRLDPASAAEAEQAVAVVGTAAEDLRVLLTQITAQQQVLAAAGARRERARRALGPAADEDRLARLHPHQLAELSAAARAAEQAAIEHHALAERHRALADPPEDPLTEVSRLEMGLALLNSWLAQPEPAAAGGVGEAGSRRQRAAIAVAAACIVALSLLLAWRVHWTMGLLSLVGIGVYWFGTRREAAGDAPPGAGRPALQEQFADLQLPAPPWNAADVRAAARRMLEDAGAAQLRRARAAARAELAAPLAAARERAEAAATARAELATRLGLDTPADWASLAGIMQSLTAWWQADEEAVGAAAALTPLQQQRDRAFTAARAALQRFGYGVTEPHELEAARESLRRRVDQHRSASDQLRALDAASGGYPDRAAQIQLRIDSLFSDAGLTGESDEAVLRQYLEQRDRYLAARRAEDVAAARLAQLRVTADPVLAARLPEQLTAELAAAETAAATERTLSDQIIAVQTRVDAARKGHELEEAEAARREAAAKLAEARQQHCDDAAGWALVEHLRRANRDRNRPAVLQSAAALFARITRGRYRLEFEERGAEKPGNAADSSGGFVAVDVRTAAGQSLDQLSAGTRVQLLLAVRVAFVEQQERGPRLPLLLDEALANSDETRAREVVEALVEICRTGRQVFYFTAQEDEVAKWREILQPAGASEAVVPCRFIDLGAARGWAASQRTPLRELAAVERKTVPAPEQAGMDRAAYGRLLAVPGIDPRPGSSAGDIPGGVHLWHLVDDLHLLHRLLCRDVHTWGQLQTMQSHAGLNGAMATGATDKTTADDATLRAGERAGERAGARAKLLETLAGLWRVGRGNPIDRAVLAEKDSGLSEVQLPRVAEVAAAAGRDARRLIGQLENRAVPTLQARKIDDLKSFLASRGYTDARPIYTAKELRLAATGALQPELDAGLLTPAEIEQAQQTWFAST
jgi:ABC-type nitrate/sulfonate/bicarbonate transport system ATPase subunit